MPLFLLFLTFIFFHPSIAHGQKLSLYSFNVFGIPVQNISQRLVSVSEEINGIQPDIVTLQEVNLSSQTKYLQTLQANYHFFYTPGLIFNSGGLLTLVNKKLDKPTDYTFIKFNQQGKILSLELADRLLGKGFSSLYFKQYNLYLINTHLTANYSPSQPNLEVHPGQIASIFEFIEKQSKLDPTSSFLISGDFNFTPNTSAYQLIIEKQCHDLTTGLGASIKANEKTKPKKIDYIFYSGPQTPDCQINYLPQPKFLSDHKAIFAKITLQ